MSPILPAIFAATLIALPAIAQDAAPANAPSLAVELNALQPTDGGCRVTFLATNRLGAALERAAVEVAVFAPDGAVDRLVTLDFKALAEGRTKVLQFELAGLDCAGIGRVLVNDMPACEGTGIAPAACLAGLVATARPDVEFSL